MFISGPRVDILLKELGPCRRPLEIKVSSTVVEGSGRNIRSLPSPSLERLRHRFFELQ